jgi:hypothetical protein
MRHKTLYLTPRQEEKTLKNNRRPAPREIRKYDIERAAALVDVHSVITEPDANQPIIVFVGAAKFRRTSVRPFRQRVTRAPWDSQIPGAPDGYRRRPRYAQA